MITIDLELDLGVFGKRDFVIEFDRHPSEPESWGYHGGSPAVEGDIEVYSVKLINGKNEIDMYNALTLDDFKYIEQLIKEQRDAN